MPLAARAPCKGNAWTLTAPLIHSVYVSECDLRLGPLKEHFSVGVTNTWGLQGYQRSP